MCRNCNVEKFYLGLNLGFNSSACLMSNKRGIIAAISEERMNGEKNTKAFPFKAIDACIKLAGPVGTIKYFEKIGVAYYQNITLADIAKHADPSNILIFSEFMLGTSITNYNQSVLGFIQDVIGFNCGIEAKDIERIEHHSAHQASSICFHGMPKDADQAIYVSADGFGDGFSSRICVANGEVLSNNRINTSLGLIYQFVTGALGYKEHQHEGKITGLAAFGKPLYIEKFKAIIDNVWFGIRSDNVDKCLAGIYVYDEILDSPIEDFDLFLRLRSTVYTLVKGLLAENKEPKDIAASVQLFIEQECTEWITRNVLRYYTSNGKMKQDSVDIYLSGGLFANVKLNQRIHELPFTRNVYVAPCMGDEGTALGAAYLSMKNDIGLSELNKSALFIGNHSAALGTSAYDSLYGSGSLFSTVCMALRNYNKYDENIDITQFKTGKDLSKIKFLAKALSENKIVCMVQGRMEFGPRALCNRSILYTCQDGSVNSWLNEKLGRTEFMPFAPFCKAENANDLFINVDGAEQTAEYMTITFDCTEEFAENYPAACHVDNTARPQLVYKETNALAYDILDEYESLTGKKALINTSFNMHNDPIIESIEKAISSWIKSETNILMIENIVIERRKN